MPEHDHDHHVHMTQEHVEHANDDSHTGHGHHVHGDHGDHVGQFRRLFWINLVIGIPVVLFSPMFGHLLGYDVPEGALWIAPLVGTVMYVWGGWPFLSGAVNDPPKRPG